MLRRRLLLLRSLGRRASGNGIVAARERACAAAGIGLGVTHSSPRAPEGASTCASALPGLAGAALATTPRKVAAPATVRVPRRADCGPAAAGRELDRPLPASVSARRGEDDLISDPFKDAGMRLTYRTVRVLMAIAQHPQASNRQIGESAGITDQGQISKLLGRLERIGLASNTWMHPGKGAPNSWTLTEKGERFAENIRANTEGSQSHGASER